ncbi:MAG: gamma-glutamyl-gamma-aminobutyrate hydrolase family protein [Rhodospirillaceae bacterium]
MKIIAVTQRVDIITTYNERRDALDQAWTTFLTACGVLFVPIPNDPQSAAGLVQSLDIAGVLFTGGNDLVSCGGDAPERDAMESRLFDWTREHRVPLLGVCRGMQVIQQQLGVPLKQVDGHAGKRHDIEIENETRSTNSFHNFAAFETVDGLSIMARSSDGVIESVCHNRENILGIMWHPERDDPFDSSDIDMFRTFYGVEA